ncbi:MAG: D-glycero-beta-D-manno-heptose 1-phosphate adenylyltransferase [Pirellulales bacterium]|nr:D-glycero-beta-D-manno-heptose 1-phosphate adenylyltransferase [Pirellulales bacterium]
MPDAADIIRSFAGLHAVVVGEAMLDRYSTGVGRRICPEAPVPVVDGCSTVSFAGGAANTAVNLRELGAEVTFLSVVGRDAEGDLLREILERHEVDLSCLQAAADRRTLTKHRILAGDQMMLRFDHGTTSPLAGAAEAHLISHLEELNHRADLVVVSDYDYGILTSRTLAALRRLQWGIQRTLAVDSRRLPHFKYLGVTAVKPNFAETLALLDGRGSVADQRRDFVLTNSTEILRRTGAQIVAVTLDEDGAVVLERGQAPHRTAATPAPHCQAAGAGDTYLAALALSLAAGAPTGVAAELAAAAAEVVVHQCHTAACTAAELLHAVQGEHDPGDLAGLAVRMDRYRQAGRRIVFTNGCFDILHHGHVTYLQRAKALGDVLVVGVNSDESIRRLKGPDRPINCLEDRLGVLAGLGCIDHVASFDESTPDRLIKAVRPDVFVKGGDYTRDSLPEAPLVEELGGRVVILPLLQNRSTTNIVARIRQSHRAARRADFNGSPLHAADVDPRPQTALHST